MPPPYHETDSFVNYEYFIAHARARAAANLDETAFPEPESFRLDRPSGVQLGWGHGPHTCVGLHLAKLEMNALVRAMVPQVSAVETGEPGRLLNNTLQGISRLPARFVPS